MEQHYSEPGNVNEILAQPIWYNSYIKIQRKWAYNNAMYHGGIKKIIDLYDLDEGRFYSYQEFCELYTINIPYLEYYGLCAAIPKTWKQILRVNLPSPESTEKTWFEKYTDLAKGRLSKNLYGYL